MISHQPTPCLTKLQNNDTIQKEWSLLREESARRFLKDADADIHLRNKFNSALNPDQFIKIASELGYIFSTENLLTVVKEQSQGVTERRDGVWYWLRSVNWIDKDKIHNPSVTRTYKAEQAEKFMHLQVDVELLLQQMLELKHKNLVELDRVLATRVR